MTRMHVRWRNTLGSRRQPLALLATAILFFSVAPSGNGQVVDGPGATESPGRNDQPRPAKTDETSTSAYERPRIKWELLDFLSGPSSPSYRAVKSVCIIEFKDAWNNPLSANTPIKERIKSDDPLVMKRTARGLCFAERSVLSDLAPKYFAMDNVAWGILRVTATDGEFDIFIYRDKFAVDFVGDGRSSFWSWTLARVVQDLYFRKTGKHLDQTMLDSLSGELSIRSAEQEYEKESGQLQKSEGK